MMTRLPRRLLLSSAIALGLCATPSFAQDRGVLEEITVTARKFEETLQDIPASVTVFTADRLERSGVERAEDFIYMTPGVSMVDSGEVGDTQVNIRGINGSRDAENSYALIVDGILMTNPAALNREYSTLSQIEILKGPQGALYGRNASAGAIIINTNRPTDKSEGKFKLSVAEDSTQLVTGSFGGAINPGQSWYNVHADYRSSDGFYSNTFLNDDIVDDFEAWNIGGRYVWDNGTTELDAKFRYGQVDAASISFNAAFALPAFVDALTPVFGADFAGLFYENVNDHNFDFVNNIDPQNDQTSLELSFKVDHEMDWADLTAWFLYSDIENSLSADGTSGAFGFFFDESTGCPANVDALLAQGLSLPAPQVLAPIASGFAILGPYTPTTCDGTQYQERNQEDFSFEVRLSGEANDRTRWQAGVYYLNIDREVGVNQGIDLGQGILEQLYAPPGSSNPTEQLVHDNFETDVFALFGQVAYDMTDDVELSFALRYDREARDVNNLVPTDARTQFIDCDGPPFLGGDPINTGLCPAVNPTGVIAPQSETFDEIQPKLAVTWDINDEWTAFSSLGVGFKSGGFNNQGAAATINTFINGGIGIGVPGPNEGFAPVAILDTYDKETSTSFEVGVKSRLMEGRLNLEAAYYHTEVDDLQFFEFFVGAFGLLRVVNSIDEVEMDGFELAADWAVNDNLRIYAGAAFVDSEISAMRSRPDVVGNESPYTPDMTFNLGLSYTQPVGGGWDFLANADYSHVGETWFHVIQDQQRPTLFGPPGDFSLTRRDSYGLLNLRVGMQNENWTVIAFARNATDETYLEEVIPAPEFGGSFVHPGDLRRAGVEVSYRF